MCVILCIILSFNFSFSQVGHVEEISFAGWRANRTMQVKTIGLNPPIFGKHSVVDNSMHTGAEWPLNIRAFWTLMSGGPVGILAWGW